MILRLLLARKNICRLENIGSLHFMTLNYVLLFPLDLSIRSRKAHPLISNGKSVKELEMQKIVLGQCEAITNLNLRNKNVRRKNTDMSMPITQQWHWDDSNNSWQLTRTHVRQESTPVGCVPPACAHRMHFNIRHSWRGRSSKEQVWTGPQRWLRDVTSGGYPTWPSQGDPQMNKFEQVSSDDQQMSLAARVPYPIFSGGGGTSPCNLPQWTDKVPVKTLPYRKGICGR